MESDPPEARRPRASEFEAIDRWLRVLPTAGASIECGAGDDVAWLRPNGLLAISVDTLVEGVHFEKHWCSGADIGWRALAAALSDLAASRARPLGFVVALSVEHIDAWADDVIEGLGEGARSWACPALGGDTTRTAGPAHVSVTVLGHAEGSPLRRSGARPGDRILLSGELGRSAQATASLLAGESVPWPRPRPRLDLLGVLGPATAGIDVSDGLLADALHLADASAVALVLDRAALVPAGVPERLALCGGEDYELLVTSPEPLAGFREVGRVERGSGLSFLDGQPLPPAPWGWDHGATP